MDNTQTNEAFDLWWNRFYDEHKETPTSFEVWQAAEARILALLDSLEVVDMIAAEIRNTELEARLNPHEYLDGSRALADAAIKAIKEVI